MLNIKSRVSGFFIDCINTSMANFEKLSIAATVLFSVVSNVMLMTNLYSTKETTDAESIKNLTARVDAITKTVESIDSQLSDLNSKFSRVDERTLILLERSKFSATYPTKIQPPLFKLPTTTLVIPEITTKPIDLPAHNSLPSIKELPELTIDDRIISRSSPEDSQPRRLSRNPASSIEIDRNSVYRQKAAGDISPAAVSNQILLMDRSKK